ncbi:hypothetical protein [Nocardia farcinica]|uniref:hypothetical protein n=1 Tax=Nocardia farcinica TaxID=37329 RepID=UPI0024548C7F|nr:hypothetical protein [Nocardia farcinica]
MTARTASGAPASTVPKLGRYRREKVRKLRSARGMRNLSPADALADHVNWLLDLGFTYHSIAAAAGVGVSTVRSIGQRRYPTSQIDIAGRIAAVTHIPVPEQAGLLVPSLGACRRVRGLHAIGWTNREIADRIDYHANFISACTRRHSIEFKTWDRLRAVYEELSGEVGPSPVAGKRAIARGAQPPLAWEGLDIDHPDTVPAVDADPDEPILDEVLMERILSGEHRGLVPKAERAAVLDHAVVNGWAGRRLADALNISHGAADRALVRHRAKLRQQRQGAA